jgi:hypothetical protein
MPRRTVGEALQEVEKKRLIKRAMPHSPQSFQDRVGLERRKELQGLMRQQMGPKGARAAARAAPRTSQPQVQKGKRPVAGRSQALLRTGRPHRRRGSL